jgi:hypothetical protein
MRQNLQAYINERAGHLAFVELARKAELRVDRYPSDGLDLLVTVHTDGKLGGQAFGVVVRGRASPLRDRRAAFAELYREIKPNNALPICLVLFTMADDRGYYKWADRIAEPWQYLDVAGMQSLLEYVSIWHQTNVSSAA